MRRRCYELESESVALAPEEFISVAEETGLIRELGWWNLREACRQMSEWRARAGNYSHLTISVNLSPKQFLQPSPGRKGLLRYRASEIEKFISELERLSTSGRGYNRSTPPIAAPKWENDGKEVVSKGLDSPQR